VRLVAHGLAGHASVTLSEVDVRVSDGFAVMHCESGLALGFVCACRVQGIERKISSPRRQKKKHVKRGSVEDLIEAQKIFGQYVPERNFEWAGRFKGTSLKNWSLHTR
jgi:hypothetical protein